MSRWRRKICPCLQWWKGHSMCSFQWFLQLLIIINAQHQAELQSEFKFSWRTANQVTRHICKKPDIRNSVAHRTAHFSLFHVIPLFHYLTSTSLFLLYLRFPFILVYLLKCFIKTFSNSGLWFDLHLWTHSFCTLTSSSLKYHSWCLQVLLYTMSSPSVLLFFPCVLPEHSSHEFQFFSFVADGDCHSPWTWSLSSGPL